MALRYSWATILILVIAIITCAGDSNATAPSPLVCLVDATDLVLYGWGHYHDPIEIYDWQWDELQEIGGDNIWAGYDAGGWEVPDDIRGQWKIVGQMDGEPIEIWMWAGSDDYYYLFAFDNTKPFAAEDGSHYGIHPCGNGRIAKLPILNLIAKIQDNVDLWADWSNK